MRIVAEWQTKYSNAISPTKYVLDIMIEVYRKV